MRPSPRPRRVLGQDAGLWKQHFFSLEGPRRRRRQMLLANESERHMAWKSVQ